MFAVILDENKYIESYSDRFRKPESIVVDSIPDESDPEKLKCYKYSKKKFVFDAEKWAAIEAERAAAEKEREKAAERQALRNQIDALKQEIESTDYQIIKCYEYALNNLDLPYDVAELHAERQALRDQINALEENLHALSNTEE